MIGKATAGGVTRRWTRLEDYGNEVSEARIYAGFHYRFSTNVGKAMGKKIGERTVKRQLLNTATPKMTQQ